MELTPIDGTRGMSGPSHLAHRRAVSNCCRAGSRSRAKRRRCGCSSSTDDSGRCGMRICRHESAEGSRRRGAQSYERAPGFETKTHRLESGSSVGRSSECTADDALSSVDSEQAPIA